MPFNPVTIATPTCTDTGVIDYRVEVDFYNDSVDYSITVDPDSSLIRMTMKSTGAGSSPAGPTTVFVHGTAPDGVTVSTF